jgi:hypothetical protein
MLYQRGVGALPAHAVTGEQLREVSQLWLWSRVVVHVHVCLQVCGWVALRSAVGFEGGPTHPAIVAAVLCSGAHHLILLVLSNVIQLTGLPSAV